jgi:hypothetical protein
MATMQDRWLGVPVVVPGMDGPTRARLTSQVARWQQARRQYCLSLLLGQPSSLDDPALVAILPDRLLRQEARRWALWLVSGQHGLNGWYRQTLQAMPAEPLWDREREFYAALKLQEQRRAPEDASRLWRWHRRRGLDLTPWLGEQAPVPVTPARLHPWIEHGLQPLLGQWLYWDERWVIHLFWPGQAQDSRTLPRVAAALLLPPLVSPASGDYRVQKGDTLWGIAQSRTGSGMNWQRIYAANRQQIANPHRIFPGQVLTVPGPAPAPAAPADEGGITVRTGDTLWRISQRQSGHGSWWPQLWQANRDRLRRPDRLAVGMTLRRPVSWSSGLQPVAMRPLPALAPMSEGDTAPGATTIAAPTAVSEAAKLTALPRPPKRAIRQAPSMAKRPVAKAPKDQAPGAMPPPPVARTGRQAAPPGEPPPLVPTVPEEAPRLAAPVQPAVADPLPVTLPAAGKPATPLNRPASSPSESAAGAVPPVTWTDPAPLQPMPEPSPAGTASDAAAGADGPQQGVASQAPSDQLAQAEKSPGEPAGAAPTQAVPDLPEAEPVEDPVRVPVEPSPEKRATLRPGQGGSDPWEAWMRPDQPDPSHPQRLATFQMPQLAPAALWPQVGWSGMPEYTIETAARETPLSGWALNRQRLSAEWQSGSWLLRGRWTMAQYGLSGAEVRAERQESWVDVDFGQSWQAFGQFRFGVLARGTWWQRRGGMGAGTSLRAADIQGFGLGPVGQAEVRFGGGHALLAEAAVQPLMGVSFSGPLQAAGQLGQVEGMVGWRGHWGAFHPHLGYRARWIYDADGRFGTVAHGMTAGLALGWPGTTGD